MHNARNMKGKATGKRGFNAKHYTAPKTSKDLTIFLPSFYLLNVFLNNKMSVIMSHRLHK